MGLGGMTDHPPHQALAWTCQPAAGVGWMAWPMAPPWARKRSMA